MFIVFDLRKIIRILFFAIFLLAGRISVFAASVRDVVISGNARTDDSIIMNYLDLSIGEKYTSNDINQSVKNLYDTGLFEKADINVKNNIIYVDVVENPIITDILFDGNRKIKDDVLLSEMSLTKRSVFNKNKLANDTKRIVDIYRRTGRFLATVEPKIIEDSGNRIRIVFEINEGRPAKIRHIFFVGANSFDHNDLKYALMSKESKVLRFGAASTYDPARIEYDKELLRRFYYSKGYADFEVLSSVGEIDRGNRWFDITLLIDEGKKYNFGEVKLTNNIKKVDDEMLLKIISKLKPGKTFNAELMNTATDNLTAELAKLGFAFVNVRPLTYKNNENMSINVDFTVDESPRVYVGEIKIIGNTRTYDNVIRRELRIEEGDPFNLTKFNRSQQRVKNLGFFETVDFRRERGDEPNKVNIIIEVAEKKTGELNFGVGYSTVDGANVNVRVKESNLLGKGQNLGLDLMYAKYTKDVDISYGTPYFLDRDLYAGFNIFYTKNDERDSVNYNENRYGFGLNMAYGITEYLNQRLFYLGYKEEILNISADYRDIIRESNALVSLIGQTLSYDRRNSRFNTTSGFLANWTLEYAGIGGDKHYIKNIGSASVFIPVIPSYITLRLGAKGGTIEGVNDRPINPVDAFYLGGDNFRGFKYGGVGPRVINPATGSAKGESSIGGKDYYVAEAELKFPLGFPKEYGISGILFVNAGTLTNVDVVDNLGYGDRYVDSGSIRAAGGFSISWLSPMGPLRFDFSKVIKKEYYDESESFRFSFDANF